MREGGILQRNMSLMPIGSKIRVLFLINKGIKEGWRDPISSLNRAELNEKD
mgnify:CR=1 FL=1